MTSVSSMLHAPGYMDFTVAVKMCDILIHAPLVVSRGTLDYDVKKHIRKDTRTVYISQISFKGYAPYKNTNFTRRNYKLKLFGTIYYPFLYEIPIINDMLENGCSNDEILAKVSEPDLYYDYVDRTGDTEVLSGRYHKDDSGVWVQNNRLKHTKGQQK